MAEQLEEETAQGQASPKAHLCPLVTHPTNHASDHTYSSQLAKRREWALLRQAVLRPGAGPVAFTKDSGAL